MLTLGQLKGATCSRSNYASLFLDAINETCEHYSINTPIRYLTFLSQVGHESGRLFYTEELASGLAYENRLDLGNTHTGDGRRFKGRGLIQITGRANYTSISNEFHIDAVAEPTLLGASNVNTCNADQLRNAALSAGWFWDRHHLNDIADQMDITRRIGRNTPNLSRFIHITQRINGGTNGLQDRVNRYVTGRPYFTNIII